MTVYLQIAFLLINLLNCFETEMIHTCHALPDHLCCIKLEKLSLRCVLVFYFHISIKLEGEKHKTFATESI